MRLESIKVRGLGPFREEQELSLSDIPGDVIALTGENGAGKSTLSELWPAAMFRECPTRGKLASLATERNAYVEATVVNGARYTIRQSVDATSGKGESLILNGAGEPVLPDTKVSSFDGWAKTHLPTSEVFFASQFGFQASGGVLAMGKSDRKAVVLRALGIEYLEGLAEKARESRRETEQKRAALLTRFEDEQKRGGNPESLLAERTAFTAEHTDAGERLTLAEAQLESAREAAKAEALARQAYEAALEKRATLRAELKKAEGDLRDTQERIANNQTLSDGAVEIREAVASLPGLHAAMREAHSELGNRKASVTRHEGKLAQTEQEVTAARKRLTEAERRAAATEARLARAAQVEDAEKRLPALREALKEAEAHLDVLELELANARAAHVAGAEERIELLRDGLQYIADGDSADPVQDAAIILGKDDALVETSKSAPLEVARLERETLSAKRKVEATRSDVASWEKLADQREAIDQAAATLEQDRAAQAEERDALKLASERIPQVKSELEDAYEALRRAEGKARSVGEELAEAEKTAKRLERLTQVETRLAELKTLEQTQAAQIGKFETDLRDAPEPVPPTAAPELSPLIAAVEAARRDQQTAAAAMVRLEADIATARASAKRLGELGAELQELDDELSDWTRLAADLGRDGLQAVEIDAAGPVITQLTNDLLHEAFGTRFTISFETTRLSSDGKKEIEDFKISVLDTLKGREADALTYSGGEKVILSEALALALTMLACNRSGVENPTIIRDESGAALSRENGQRYVAMLRRAGKLVKADKVLFISHDPATWDLADARINVCDGRIAVS